MTLLSGLSGLASAGPAQSPANVQVQQSPSVEFSPGSTGEVTVPAQRGVLLQAWINGNGPIDVVFDTGSGNLISSSLARRLGIKIEGSGTVTGFGGSAQVQGAEVDRIQIGGLTMRHQIFAVFDPPAASGRDFVVVGDQLLLHTVVRIDFDRQRITFFDQYHFRYAGNGVAVAIRMQDNGILAQGSVDGILGLYGVDTGDMHSLTLFAPLVAQHDLVRHYNASVKGYAGEGFGGTSVGFYTRAGKLQLGETLVSRPVTVLSMDTQGFGASSISGNIGLHILKQFILTFDLAHEKLYLEKGAQFGKPDIFNRAGLVLDPDTDSAVPKLAIKLIFPSSSAARAGLAEGDAITELNGKPPDDDTWESYFTQPAGTEIHLTVRHGPENWQVSLTLKDVL